MQEEVARFIGYLIASDLLDESKLKEKVEEFLLGLENCDQMSNQLVAFEKSLIDDCGLLTHWQCKMLERGKYNGFHLDNYVLVDFIEKSIESTTFRAVDRRTGQLARLEVFLGDGARGTRYIAK